MKELFNYRTFKSLMLDNKNLDEVHKLRYKAYHNVGAIPENEEESFGDSYDSTAYSINHALYDGDSIRGGIRGCVYTPENGRHKVPSMEIYQEEIRREIGEEAKVYESCRMVIDPNAKKSLHAQFLLVKTSLLAAYSLGCEHIITATRERHASFYTRMGMEVIAEPKAYVGLNVPMVLILGRYLQKRIAEPFEAYPMLEFTEEDVKNYKECLESLS